MGTAAEFLLKLTALQALSSPYQSQARAEVLSDVRLGSGTTGSKFSKVHQSSRSLAGSANEDVDLATITDAEGTALGTGEVRLIIFESAAANGGLIHIKGSAANGWSALTADVSDIIILRPGELIAFTGFVDGNLDIGAADKSLNVANQDGSAATYTLTVLTTDS